MVAVKGGVWTNVEDEILKVSVSKYGLNQWARVSSLLPRKTSKQCKARWNEWLDPSIKKIEWSKEEDEKILHLAKLMPTQWRTIAPIVGRTANQCLERYQKLLDEAEQREASELGLTGPDGAESQAPSANDIRRLRPGEVDTQAETRPARPDAQNMDEDELEMLSEARARLANTQGKKAKRKARERQQDESRRLASLQKRRELKTAGINIKVVTRKKGQMDYNADIPFEAKPAAGFYDTSEEIRVNERQKELFDPRKQQLAVNKRKGDEDEEAGRKRRKNDKDGPTASQQAAMKAGQMQRMREAEQSSKRRELVLPAPQVGEGELEDIVKMSMMGERANIAAQSSDSGATRGLVNTYTPLNTGAPVRTPRAAPQEDRIANEIRNIRALTETQSSLLGGDNTPLHEGAGSTGFESVTPRRQVLATPNPMATPLRSGADGSATPLRPGQTPLRTPRDGLALNAQNDPATMQNQLKKGLAALPKPKDTSWELELPEEQEESAATVNGLPEDASERDRRERERQEAEAELERKRQTQVMQQGLPRPTIVDLDALLKDARQTDDPAVALIAEEAARLMASDAARFPKTGSRSSSKLPALEHFDDDDLAQAKLSLLVETKQQSLPEEIEAALNHINANTMLLGLGCYDDDDEEEQSATMRAAHEEIQESMLESAEAGAKLEKKLMLHLGGYRQRAEMLRKKIGDTATELEKARNALVGFTVLARSEEQAVASRLAVLRDEVSAVSTREREAQSLYRANMEELRNLGVNGTNGYH